MNESDRDIRGADEYESYIQRMRDVDKGMQWKGVKRNHYFNEDYYFLTRSSAKRVDRMFEYYELSMSEHFTIDEAWNFAQTPYGNKVRKFLFKWQASWDLWISYYEF